MTKEFYRTGHFEADHSTFGGTICQSDFETEHRGKNNRSESSIASRIVRDWRFDEQCRRNIEARNRFSGEYPDCHDNGN